ncbi:MAG: hypothetical protein J7621_08445 [Niastella sp.]|nr:hypothetical protein [Niastella sp.]
MKKYVAPALLMLIWAGCGNKPEKGATSFKDSTTTVSSNDSLKPGTVVSKDHSTKEPIVATVKQVLTHIPDGYFIIDTCSGDLNLDNENDFLILLGKKGEDSLSRLGDEPVKRRLLVLTHDKGEHFNLAAQSDNAVYCYSCGGILGDPYQQLVIKNGYFSVEHYGGSRYRWTRIVTFKYSPADSTWLLHKDGHETEDTMGEEKPTKKVYTAKDFGKVTFTDFDIYKD